MDDIFINRLYSTESIYAEIASKLGKESISGTEELAQILKTAGISQKFKVYVSNETNGDNTADEITEVFRNCINADIVYDEFVNLISDGTHLTSEAKPRSLVHRNGDLHPAVHVWIIKHCDMGIYVLLQKRSHEKLINPDCYDVSAAGHLSQGDEFRSAAVREAAEELGINIPASKLEFIGMLENRYIENDIDDNELRAVYIYREDVDINNLVLQESEVSEVCWAEIDELLSSLHSFHSCIDTSELELIKKFVF